MLSQKQLADVICEAAIEADALVEEYLKKYIERRLSEEKAALVRRLDALEATAALQKGHNA